MSVGPNEMWCLDQHDKFKRFRLFFHVGLDPFPGVIHWCKVWWTVRNPKLIARFYLNVARAIGGVYMLYLYNFILIFYLGIPLITQSDPGTENVNVAYVQTALRHQMEPSLDGSFQHRWFRKHGNIKPEIHWSVFRRDWAVGFQALLERGVDEGYYDVGDPLEWYVNAFLHPLKTLINVVLGSDSYLFHLSNERSTPGSISATGLNAVLIARRFCPMAYP